MGRLLVLSLLVLAGAGAAVLGTGAGAATQAAPHLVLSGGLAGPCPQGPVTVSGTAASAELGMGTFESTITVTSASGALVTYAETFRATFGRTVVTGSIPTSSAQGTCGPNGITFSRTFRATISSPDPGVGNSDVSVSQGTYTHTFTPDPAPPSQTTVTGATTTTGSPYPRLSVGVSASWRSTKVFTKVVSLRVNAPSGARVALTCTGKRAGCPFSRKAYAIGAAGRVALTSAFKSARLKPGAHLQLRITKPGAVGRVVDYTVRKLKTPRATVRCLPPGAATPAKC